MHNHDKDTVAGILRDTYCPLVACLTSYDAESICQKNNFAFCDMLVPFCQLSTEVIKDPHNQNLVIRGLRVDIRDLRTDGFLQTAFFGQVLADAVKSCNNDQIVPLTIASSTSGHSVGSTHSLNSAESSAHQFVDTTDWFAEFRKRFVQLMEPGDHEFLRHYLACILVVSSSNPDPLDQFTQLGQMQHSQQHQLSSSASATSAHNTSNLSVISADLTSACSLPIPCHAVPPRWFSPNIFKYHVLVHDNFSGDDTRAESVYQSMKMTYGAHACHLVRINSIPLSESSAVPSPDPWQLLLKHKYQVFNAAGSRSSSLSSSGASRERKESFYSPMPVNGTNDSTDAVNARAERYSTESIPHPLSQCDLTNFYKSSDQRYLHAKRIGEPSSEIRYGQCLNAADIDRIKIFVQEFYLRGLLPFVERQMRLLSDQAEKRRRGQSGLLTRFGFSGGGSRVSSTSGPSGTSIVYSQESAEMQVRRLADLCFMFQHYEMAYSLYHSLKRDFQNDGAWLYFAGSAEMTALSVFLMGPAGRPFPFNYMDAVLTHYHMTCSKPFFAIRATVFFTEILKSMEMYSDAAAQYIKMTSVYTDLVSALFLEQAAFCFLRAKMVRKYALHLILAGHRYSKASQSWHSLNCYKQALEVYKNKNWFLAEDHINFTIGNQCLILRNIKGAASAFSRLFPEYTLQYPSQQLGFLREYLKSVQLLQKETVSGSPGTLVLPVILSQRTESFFGDVGPVISNVMVSEKDGTDWQVYEHAGFLSCRISSSGTHGFKPNVYYLGPGTRNDSFKFTPKDEKFSVQVELRNPLSISLCLLNVHLIWKFQRRTSFSMDSQFNLEEPVSNETHIEEHNETVTTLTVAQHVLEPESSSKLVLSLITHGEGELSILGIQYALTMCNAVNSPAMHDGIAAAPDVIQEPGKTVVPDTSLMVTGKQFMEVRGRRLNNTAHERTNVLYGRDRRLNPLIGHRLPLLQVDLSNFPAHAIAGELVRVQIRLSNIGQLPISRICCIADDPNFLGFCWPVSDAAKQTTTTTLSWKCCPSVSHGSSSDQKYYCCHVWPSEAEDRGSLEVGSGCDLIVWYHAPMVTGEHTARFAFYYQSDTGDASLPVRYRIARCHFVVNVSPSLVLKCKSCVLCSNGTHTCDGLPSSLAVLVVRNVCNSESPVCDHYKFHLTKLVVHSPCLIAVSALGVNNDVVLSPTEAQNLCLQLSETVRNDQVQRSSEVTLSPSNCEYEKLKNTCFVDPWLLVLKESQCTSSRVYCMWKAFAVLRDGTTRSCFGYHWCNMTRDSLRSDLSLQLKPAESLAGLKHENASGALLEQLLLYSFSYNVAISSPFAELRSCMFPVTLQLRNLHRFAITVHISTHNFRSAAMQQPFYREYLPVSWLQLRHCQVQLKSGEGCDIALTGFVNNPGVYCLGTFNLIVTPAVAESVCHDSRVEHCDTKLLLVIPKELHYITVKDKQDVCSN